MTRQGNAGDRMPGVATRTRRRKRSDLIVDEVKRWIVAEQMKPGDRLPSERELIEMFASSKGTIREALKSLEVQGLISVKTGPKGGAVVESVTLDRATQLLRNYLHFRHPNGAQLYGLRKLIEPRLAVSVVGKLTDEDFQAMEETVRLCDHPPASWEERRRQRIAELEFHNILVARSEDPLLALICRFLNDLVLDIVVYKKVFLPEQTDFSKSNLDYHRRLIEAFRRADADEVGRLMHDHMCAAERFNLELDSHIEQGAFLGGGVP